MLNEEKLKRVFESIQGIIDDLKAEDEKTEKEELSEEEKFDMMSDFFSKFMTLAYEHNITKHHDLHTIVLLTLLKHYVLVSQRIAKDIGVLSRSLKANEEVKQFILSQGDSLKGCIDAFFNSIESSLSHRFLDEKNRLDTK